LITGINESRGKRNEARVIHFGRAMTVIFGGGLLIRIVRDGEFYTAEFIGGIIGIILLLAALSGKKNSLTSNDNK
jgi:hypothetical protein